MRHALTRTVLLALLAPLPALAGSPSNPALAGQTVTRKIPNGQETREYARNGRLIYETVERQKTVSTKPVTEATEREWLDNGTPVRDQTFVGGKETQGTFWYMNGKVKEKRVDQSIHDPKGIAGTYVEHYSDLGQLQSSGVYQGQYRPVGVHRIYDEQGRLKQELTYGPDGVKQAEKTFDAQGAVTGSASYLPDGSRR